MLFRSALHRQKVIALDSLGIALTELGELDAAAQILLLSGEQAHVFNPTAEAHVPLNLAKLRIKQQRYSEARDLLMQCLHLSEQFNARGAAAAALHELGRVAVFEGNLDQAILYIQQSRQLYQTIGAIASEQKVGVFLATLSNPGSHLQL